MTYRARSTRRLARKSKSNFIITLIIIILLMYVTLQWILPSVITSLGLITNVFKPSHKSETAISENATLAPPILNIPYEATNSARVDIKGYATSNSRVKLFLDDNEIQTTDVLSDGDFTFKNIALSLGINNIKAKTIDEDDRESLSSKIFKIVFDNEKPLLNLSEPEDNKKIQGDEKNVKISGNTEVGAQVFINDNQVIINKDGNFSSIISLNDGDNDFDIKTIDQAGNSTEISRRVTYQP